MSKLNTFQRVRDLSDWRAVAFGATLLERSLPNYQLFCELNDFGEPEQYRNCLNTVWDWLANPKARVNLQVQLDRVEEAVPDAADFVGFGVYPAIDVCMSMTALLMLMMGDDPQGAVVISKLSQGSVEAFIEATSEEQLDADAIKAHPLMQWEIDFQSELLDRIAQCDRQKDSIQALKAMAREEGMSNIGLEME
ncbi:YjaG family protein [Bowmanella dokdonensis]|uniref:YjaG family protein n=1 Tax=Bowmanella dokdonensis TaxID=751969 RepID=A0A939DNM5_9ALTE|nr:YjaG family protein [Bowmanella dokdonensis]MBN7825967.1 YjaG family protein [Bowmanella dokdonensis]